MKFDRENSDRLLGLTKALKMPIEKIRPYWNPKDKTVSLAFVVPLFEELTERVLKLSPPPSTGTSTLPIFRIEDLLGDDPDGS